MPERPRDLAGLPASQAGIYEQQFSDLERRRRDIDRERSEGIETFGRVRGEVAGARDVSMEGARTAALMPVYSMMSQSGLAGAYSGGQTQAAAQASMLGARQAAGLGATFAERLGAMELEEQQRLSTLDRSATDVETLKTSLEQETFAAIDEAIQTDMDGMRQENWTKRGYVSSLMNAARSQTAGSRAQLAFLQEARRIANDDWMADRWFAKPGNEWALEMINDFTGRPADSETGQGSSQIRMPFGTLGEG